MCEDTDKNMEQIIDTHESKLMKIWYLSKSPILLHM